MNTVETLQLGNEIETGPVEAQRAPIPVHATLPKGTKPKYFVAGNTFYAQMEDGWELAAPIKLSVRTVRTLRDMGEEDELDQLVKLFELLGDPDTVEKLIDADFLDATEAALKYFQAWEEKNEARLGELQRSSRS